MNNTNPLIEERRPYATVTTSTNRFAYPAKTRRNIPETPAFDALTDNYPELLSALRDARYNRLEANASRTIRVDPKTRRAWCGGTQGTVLYTLDRACQGLEADCREALDELQNLARRAYTN